MSYVDMSRNVVQDGDYVVLMKSFDYGNMKIVLVSKNKDVHYGKLHFTTEPLIGCSFGSTFEIINNTMKKVDDFESYDDELSRTVSSKVSTMEVKSQFSQEKLIKKKKKKNHANIVSVLRPSLRLIHYMYYARDKLGGLRQDSLAQIMTMSNIQNGCKCLLFDHNLGILTCAVMSRILPDGLCIQLVPENETVNTTRATLNMLNIPKAMYDERLVAISVRDLYKVREGRENFSHEDEILRAKNKEHLERMSSLPTRKVRINDTGEKVSASKDEPDIDDQISNLIKKETNREWRHRERTKASDNLKLWSLDSIILITMVDHPLHLLKLTYPFLAPSRQFVIYSDTMAPLLECYQFLKSESLAVSLSISESWLRGYQVLPDRTRPDMTTTGYGGYILSGTKAFTGTKLVNFEKGKEFNPTFEFDYMNRTFQKTVVDSGL